MDQKKQFQFLLYRAEAEDVSVNALVKDETIWLTQKAMAELFGIDKSGISRHIKNIFDTGELEENVVVAKIATTTQHGAISGKTQMNETTFYNLDMISCRTKEESAMRRRLKKQKLNTWFLILHNIFFPILTKK